MSDYPKIRIDKRENTVVMNNSDGSCKVSSSVESIILAKILFELERIGTAIDSLREIKHN